MKIAIDARMLNPHFGIGRYIQQLLLNLEKIDTENQYFVLLKSENFNQFEPKNENFKKIKADVNWYGYKEQIQIPKILKKINPDLIHFPHWNVPYFYNKNFITTIHDLLLVHYPNIQASTLNPILFKLKHLAYKKILNHATKKSRRIIAVSDFTKTDIVNTLKIRPEKITTTALAPFEKPEKIASRKILETLNINKPYLLYIGASYPHKNLDNLTKAWDLFIKENGEKYNLVLCGQEDYFYKKLKNLVASKNYNNIIFTGAVSDDDLHSLYANAQSFIHPSKYEGFGMTPLEAMQYGLPVACARTTCLPDNLEDAVLYFNPDDIEEIKMAIYNIINSSDLRLKLQEKSNLVLQKYSWISTAKKTLEIYKNSV